jgi:hypothetical protein
LAGAGEQTSMKNAGRALVVGARASAADLAALGRAGLQAEYVDDPYGAMAEICRRPLAYRALVLPLPSVFKEELAVVTAVKRRYPHVAVLVSRAEGRQATLAEAMRVGVDGVLGDAKEEGGRLADQGVDEEKAEVEAQRAELEVRESDGEELEAEHLEEARPVPVVEEGLQSGQVGGPLPGVRRAVAEIVGMPGFGEPVLTADELRALLQDGPPEAGK